VVIHNKHYTYTYKVPSNGVHRLVFHQLTTMQSRAVHNNIIFTYKLSKITIINQFNLFFLAFIFILICLFVFLFYVTSTQYRSYRDVPALLVEEDLRCPSVHYLSRTKDVPSANWIASSHERIQSPCRDSNPQR
jgi:hypothetical protein